MSIDREVKKLFKIAKKLEVFLNDRGYDLDDHLTRPIVDLQAKIDLEIIATRQTIVGRLERLAEETSAWAENSMSDLSGNHIDIAGRDRQKARTEARRIQQTIELLK